MGTSKVWFSFGSSSGQYKSLLLARPSDENWGHSFPKTNEVTAWKGGSEEGWAAAERGWRQGGTASAEQRQRQRPYQTQICSTGLYAPNPTPKEVTMLRDTTHRQGEPSLLLQHCARPAGFAPSRLQRSNSFWNHIQQFSKPI